MTRGRPRAEQTVTAPAPVAPDRVIATTSWRDAMVPFFVSRAISDTLLLVIGTLRYPRTPLAGFIRWDGRWYQAIALHGYVVPPHAHHHQTPWPFFPLFPSILHFVESLGIQITWAGIICNHLALLLALIGIQRLASRHCSATAVTLAVWLTALGPMAFLFSMLYPTAIFLACSVWAFVWVDEHRDLAAGIAAAAAALTRPNGVVVLVALAIAVGLSVPRLVRLAAPVLLAIGAWIVFNAVRAHDPLRFLDAKRDWREVTIVGFVSRPTPNAALHAGIAVFALSLVLVARRRMPSSWTWYTCLYVVPSLAFGMVGLARYASDAFPPAIAGGIVLERRARTTVGAIFAALVVAQAATAWYFIGAGHVV